MQIPVRDPESVWPWIRDGKIRIRDPGSEINIPDPQHWANLSILEEHNSPGASKRDADSR